MKPLSLLLVLSLLLAGCATKAKPHAPPSAAATSPDLPPSPVPVPVPTPTPAPPKPKVSWNAALPWNWPGAILGVFIKKKPPVPVAEPPRLIGVIKMVNTEDKFVLIDASAYQAAQPGDALVCLADQRETANLRLSTLRNPPFLIGDITSGSPSPGERVYKP